MGGQRRQEASAVCNSYRGEGIVGGAVKGLGSGNAAKAGRIDGFIAVC